MVRRAMRSDSVAELDIAREALGRSDLFAALRPLVRGVAAAFGDGCEVVLHDFADLEHSIVEIAGNVTGRSVGGSVTQIGLSIAARADAAEDEIGYITRTRGGRILKSSTLLVRDAEGHVLGALCINLDVTQYRAAARLLSELAGPVGGSPADIDFSDDIKRVLDGELRQAEREVGRPIDLWRKNDRMTVVAALRRRGVFAVQRAVPFVAERLGVSRATIYAYLEDLRRLRSEESDLAEAASDERGDL